MRGWRKMVWAVMGGVLLAPAGAMAGEGLPADVRAFVHDAGICQYLGGEIDSSLPPDRQKEIIRKSARYCTGIDRRQLRLGAKYAARPDIISRIDAYDFGNPK